ncbi:hypothetical protein SDC9_30285 [bioreactor metagenome]|uniref:PRC-barrel domain-containing protein n=1 Tax=bioreactor metagenome TaxID=1076179 RepID=A0A644UZ34_9ZZZZ|nr:PRC-barrel domain-containing protein [Negativicutes bacterium]
MQKLSNLIGLPVLETVTGTQIGMVEEVLLDIDQAVICGVLIDSENWFFKAYGIGFEDLFSIGRDAIMVRGSEVIKDLADLSALSSIYRLQDLTSKQIFTETGFLLGILMDVVFDVITGEIRAYQVSDSIITDLLYGRQTMPLPQAQVIGPDKVIVPDTMAKLLHAEQIL